VGFGRLMAQSGAMLSRFRGMPGGVRVFVAYAFALLLLAGLTLPLIVEQAVGRMPITPLGVVWMLLLAYLVFTLTLVLQRKQAAYLLSLGLATLTVPLIPLLGLTAGILGAVVAMLLAAAVFGSLRAESARRWFSEP
jgi:predicted cation transporter